jgi:hypothetical protein
MEDLKTAIFAMGIVGGLYYFWFKCRLFAVSKVLLVIGILIWPFGAIVGIYWAIKDYFLFRKSGDSEDKNQ